MGILLGLLTSLTWGGADFIARFATHRIGALRSMLYMQLTGFLLLSFLLPALGGWGHLADGSGWQPWAWGFLAGSVNAMSGLALYRAFEIGKMAVVAPLSASYPALTLLLSCMTGERLSIVRILANAPAASSTARGTKLFSATEIPGPSWSLWAKARALMKTPKDCHSSGAREDC